LALTFDPSASYSLRILQFSSIYGELSHSGYTSEVKRMFLPSGDHNSPLASVIIEVCFCTAVTVPASLLNSAVHTCEPPSLVERNAKRLPSGAQRGRSAS